MKAYRRAHPQFSLCGLNCALCSMHTGGYCPGCGGGEGNRSCALLRCAASRGLEFCHDCREHPCEKYANFEEYDSFLPCRGRGRDVERARTLGLEAYLAELEEKAALLARLVAEYNDGRRKTLFHTAVYLLPPEALRALLTRLDADSAALPPQEKAALAAAGLQALADAAGVSLKLHKKPKKKQE